MGERVQIKTKTPGSMGKLPITKTQKRVFPKTKSSPAAQILYLQRTIGNREVQSLLKSGAIQASLTIGKPNDKYEQEADRVADQVMRMPERKGSLVNGHSSLVQRQTACPECPEKEEIQTKPLADQITPLAQRQIESDEEEEQVQTKLQRQTEEEEEIQTKQAYNQIPAVTSTIEFSVNSLKGEGHPHHVTAFGNSGNIILRGRTDADFNSSFRTTNVTVRQGEGCEGCSGTDCVHTTGNLVATYSVTTNVTLPRVSDYEGLSPCQQRRVQEAIDTTLAPHEQEHVDAFRTYNGRTRHRFDLTLCRSEFDSTIQSMFESEESARHSAAQAASDRLDPFEVDVDLNCEDSPATGRSE